MCAAAVVSQWEQLKRITSQICCDAEGTGVSLVYSLDQSHTGALRSKPLDSAGKAADAYARTTQLVRVRALHGLLHMQLMLAYLHRSIGCEHRAC